jgi:predicted nucleic acid-binding protein
MIVFDTNVVSELMKATPDETVLSWALAHREYGMYTTAITVAEIRLGIEQMPDGRRKARMAEAAGEAFTTFSDTVLPFDVVAAVLYPQVVVGRFKAGLPIDDADAKIAAICRIVDATLATRNTKDFVETGIRLVNPWE